MCTLNLMQMKFVTMRDMMYPFIEMSFLMLSLIVYGGQYVGGQNISLCKRPELGQPCIIKCSKEKALEEIKLFKRKEGISDANLKAECSQRGKCANNDNIIAYEWNKNTTAFTIKRLKPTDSGLWYCQSGGQKGEEASLQVYSFKEENVRVSVSQNSEASNITVDMRCVYPDPEVVMKYCGRNVCTRKGIIDFNITCENEKIERYMTVSCPLKLKDYKCREQSHVGITISIRNNIVYTTHVALDMRREEIIDRMRIYEHSGFNFTTYTVSVLTSLAITILLLVFQGCCVREVKKRCCNQRSVLEDYISEHPPEPSRESYVQNETGSVLEDYISEHPPEPSRESYVQNETDAGYGDSIETLLGARTNSVSNKNGKDKAKAYQMSTRSDIFPVARK